MIFRYLPYRLLAVFFILSPVYSFGTASQVYSFLYNGGQTQYIQITTINGIPHYLFVEPDLNAESRRLNHTYVPAKNTPFEYSLDGYWLQPGLTPAPMPAGESVESFISKHFKVRDSQQGSIMQDVKVSSVVPMRTATLNTEGRSWEPLSDKQLELLLFNKDRARSPSGDSEGLAFAIPDNRDLKQQNAETVLQIQEQRYWDKKIATQKDAIKNLKFERVFSESLREQQAFDAQLVALNADLSVLENKRAALGIPIQDLYDIKKSPIRLDSAGMPIHRPANDILSAKNISFHRVAYTPAGSADAFIDMVAYERLDGGFFYHRVSFDGRSLDLLDTPAPLALKENANDRYMLYRFPSEASTILRGNHASVEGVVAYAPTKNRDDFFAYYLFDSHLTDGTPVVYRGSQTASPTASTAQMQALLNALNKRAATHQTQQRRLEIESITHKAVLAQDSVFSAKGGVLIDKANIPAYTSTLHLSDQFGLTYVAGSDLIIILPPYDSVNKRSLGYRLFDDESLDITKPIAIDARNPNTIVESLSAHYDMPIHSIIRGSPTSLSYFEPTTMMQAHAIQQELAALPTKPIPVVRSDTSSVVAVKMTLPPVQPRPIARTVPQQTVIPTIGTLATIVDKDTPRAIVAEATLVPPAQGLPKIRAIPNKRTLPAIEGLSDVSVMSRKRLKPNMLPSSSTSTVVTTTVLPPIKPRAMGTPQRRTAPRTLPSLNNRKNCFSSISSLSASLVAVGGACDRHANYVVDASATPSPASTVAVSDMDTKQDIPSTKSSAKSKKPKAKVAQGVGKKKALLGGSVVAAIVGVILLSVGIGVGVSKSSSSKTDSSTNPDDGKQPTVCWCVDDQGNSYECQPIADGVCPAAMTASVFSRREEEAVSSETIRRRHQYGLGMDTLSSYTAGSGNSTYFSSTGQTIIAGQSNTIGLSGGRVLKVETGVHRTLNTNNTNNDSYYVALGHKQPLTATMGVLTKMVHSTDDGVSDTAIHAFGYKSFGQVNLYGGASFTNEDTTQDTWGVVGAEYATKLRAHHSLSVSGQVAYKLSDDPSSNPTLGTLGVSYGYAPSTNTSLSLMGAVDTDGYTHLKASARLAF